MPVRQENITPEVLIYIKKSGEITMVNLVTGEQKEVNNNK